MSGQSYHQAGPIYLAGIYSNMFSITIREEELGRASGYLIKKSAVTSYVFYNESMDFDSINMSLVLIIKQPQFSLESFLWHVWTTNNGHT